MADPTPNQERRGATEVVSPEAMIERFAALEQAVESLSVQLEASSGLSTLGLMSAIMAHELRNVLTPVLSYAQLAKSRPNDPEAAQRAIDRTVAGIEAASEIIESTLAMAHSDGTSDEVSAVLSEAFEEARQGLPRDPARDSITVKNLLAPDLRVGVQPGVLRQLFTNLLFNAWEALREFRCAREKLITVRTVGSSNAHFATIEVRDNGPGLPPELSDHIFQPFITSHSARSATSGSGLGLMICRQLVERAGGSIRVESTPGEGAAFIFDLPLMRQSMRKAS